MPQDKVLYYFTNKHGNRVAVTERSKKESKETGKRLSQEKGNITSNFWSKTKSFAVAHPVGAGVAAAGLLATTPLLGIRTLKSIAKSAVKGGTRKGLQIRKVRGALESNIASIVNKVIRDAGKSGVKISRKHAMAEVSKIGPRRIERLMKMEPTKRGQALEAMVFNRLGVLVSNKSPATRALWRRFMTKRTIANPGISPYRKQAALKTMRHPEPIMKMVKSDIKKLKKPLNRKRWLKELKNRKIGGG